jgi:hypothetical protein
MTRSVSVSNVKMDDLLQMLDTVQEQEALLKEKVKALHDADEMDEMDLLQLQDLMQKQNQTFQMLSNIMKNQHDSVQTIIRNIR